MIEVAKRIASASKDDLRRRLIGLDMSLSKITLHYNVRRHQTIG